MNKTQAEKTIAIAMEATKSEINQESAAEALIAFGAEVLYLHRNGGEPGDLDYDDLHKTAVATGVVIEVNVTKPCREDCVCSSYVRGDGFPTTCIRYAPGVKEIINRVIP